MSGDQQHREDAYRNRRGLRVIVFFFHILFLFSLLFGVRLVWALGISRPFKIVGCVFLPVSLYMAAFIIDNMALTHPTTESNRTTD